MRPTLPLLTLALVCGAACSSAGGPSAEPPGASPSPRPPEPVAKTDEHGMTVFLARDVSIESFFQRTKVMVAPWEGYVPSAAEPGWSTVQTVYPSQNDGRLEYSQPLKVKVASGVPLRFADLAPSDTLLVLRSTAPERFEYELIGVVRVQDYPAATFYFEGKPDYAYLE